MSKHELEKLLGGFAADTLTPEEKQALYTAVLQDQQLFNALADEQALKELLADPVVRQRLLHSLNQSQAAGSSHSLSWFNWLKRPGGLAFAGGLAAAALAVVLGTKMYQTSLKQAVQSVATEETKPSPSQLPEPQSKANETAEPAPAPPKKDGLLDKMVKRERSAPSKSEEQHAPDAAGAVLKQPSEQDIVRQQDNTPTAGPGKTNQEVVASANQKSPAASSAPPAAAPESQPMRAPANAPAAGIATPALSARALFYRALPETTAEAERRSATPEEADSDSRRTVEGPRKEKHRAERSTGLLGKLEHPTASAGMPLGLRYSLIMAGPGGIDMEVDPSTAVGQDDAPRLAVQTNENGYLFVLYARQPSDKPIVLFPSSGDGRITGRTTIAVALADLFREQPPPEQLRLLVWFSRTPRNVSSALSPDKKVPRLLIEQVDPGQPGATAEQAVYVVSQDPSLADLSVEIPLSLH